MMKLKSLIATLVLSSTSIAAADTIVRDHRTPTTTTSTVSTSASLSAHGSIVITLPSFTMPAPKPVVVVAPPPPVVAPPAPVVVTPPPPVAPLPTIAQPAKLKLKRNFEVKGAGHIIRPHHPIYRPLPAPTYFMLANDMSLKGRGVIEVGNLKRQFSKLELRAEGTGRIDIDRVMIVFGNGQRQMVNLDTKLNKKQPKFSIDLQGDTRTIDKIVLFGKTSGRAASLDVLAL